MLFVAGPVYGQQGDWEVGLDAALTHAIVSDADDVTSVDVPVARIRAGVFVSPVVSLEPSLAFSTTSVGEANVTHFAMNAAAHYHFSKDITKLRWYVAPTIGFDLESKAFNPQPEPPAPVVNDDSGRPPVTCRSTKPGRQWPCVVDAGFWSGSTTNPLPTSSTCADCGNSDTQFRLGLVAGMKIPVHEHLAVRVETGYAHGFETSERNAGDLLSLAVGGSFFIW
jgi:hypothetical protein